MDLSRWLLTGLVIAAAGCASCPFRGDGTECEDECEDGDEDGGGCLLCEDEGEAGKPGELPPGMPPEMVEYMKLSLPGPGHARLARIVGEWDYVGDMWPAPGAPPTAMNGEMDARMVLGGRYLVEDYEGTSMGLPFAGVATTAFDNIQQMYLSSWIDSWSTGIMYSTGSADATGKVLTMSGEMVDPMGGKCTMRSVSTEIDADHMKMEMYAPMPGADGKPVEMKMMELRYTRKK